MRIDGKYEVISQLSQAGGRHILYTVQGVPRVGEAAGEPHRLDWFEISTPDERSAFGQYRVALKALNPAGLSEVVARPDASYTLWRTLQGAPLASGGAVMASNLSPQGYQALEKLSQQLAQQGYALSDAEIVWQEGTPAIARLPLPIRTPQEARKLSTALLSTLKPASVASSQPPQTAQTEPEQAKPPKPATRQARAKKVPPSPRPKISVWSWLPGLLLLLGAGYVTAQAIQIYLNPAITDVPQVVGKAGKEAGQLLSKQGFRVQYLEGDRNGAPLGSVIQQDPEAGSNLHLGRLVTLTVNNPPALKVPKLEDLTPDQAKAVLSENRLQLASATTVDGTLTGTPQGHIVAQIPPSDSVIRRGQTVKILVSGGVTRAQTWLPDLRGLSFEDASTLVKRAGMVVHTVSREPSEQAENTILRQNPAAYTKAAVGSPVTLVVSQARYQPPTEALTPLPVPPPPPPPVEETPSTDDTAPVPTLNADGTQIVPMVYTFPANLPSGKVEILVRDEQGEHVILPPTDSTNLIGATAQRNDIRVHGNYVFMVRVDGKDFATFGP